MTGIALTYQTDELTAAAARLDALGGFATAELVEDVAAVLESGARRRISEEKAGPDGEAWAAWSDTYAANRQPRHSLLVSGGDLLDSIEGHADGTAAIVGSNLVYAAIHQLGGEAGRRSARVTIPARPYLGVSDADALEISDLIEGRIAEMLQ